MDIQQQILDNMKEVSGAVKLLAEGVKARDARMDAIEKAVKDSQDEVKSFLELNKHLTETGEFKRVGVSVPGAEEKNDGKEFSFFRAGLAISTNRWDLAPYEAEVFRATDEKRGISHRERVMSTSTDSLGGYIVPNQIMADFIELLRPALITRALGARFLEGLVGAPVEWPKQVGGATAFWTAENQAITESDLTLGQLNMMPHQLSALVKLSSRLLRMSQPSAEAEVRRDMAEAIGEQLDITALRGAGTSGQPLGIANTIGIQTVAIGANGGRFDFTHAEEMRRKLAAANAERGSLGFAAHPNVSSLLRSERIAQFSGQTTGMYVTLPMSRSAMAEQLGFSLQETTQIPTNLTKGAGTNLSEVYFANWNELLIGIWLNMELAATNQAGDSWQKNQTWVKANIEADIQLRHPESFCLVSDANSL